MTTEISAAAFLLGQTRLTARGGTHGAYGATDPASFGNLRDMYDTSRENHYYFKTVTGKHLATRRGVMAGIRKLGSVLADPPASSGIFAFEGDNLPTPRTPRYFNPQDRSKWCFSRLRFSIQALYAARKGQQGAWKDIRMDDLKTSRDRWDLNLEHNMWMGICRAVALTSANHTAGVYPLYDGDLRNSQNDNRFKLGAQYVHYGQSLTTVNAVAGAVVPYGAITAQNNLSTTTGAFQGEAYVTGYVKGASPTATASDTTNGFVGSGTAAADETLLIPFRSRMDGAMPSSSSVDFNDYFASYSGVEDAIANATMKPIYMGINRNNYQSMEGKRLNQGSAGAVPFNSMRIAVLVDSIDTGGTGNEPDIIVGEHSARRAYAAENMGNMRFPEVFTKKGFKGELSFVAGRRPLAFDVDAFCPLGSLNVFNTSSWGKFIECPYQPLDDADRFIVDKPQTEVIYCESGQIVCKAPYDNGVIEDILVSSRDIVEV